MTTVAWRGGVMAADTMMTFGSTLIDGRIKIARRDDGALIGAAGLCGRSEAFRAWALGGEVGNAPDMKDSTGIIVEPDGAVRVFDGEENGSYTIRPPYFAIGSGTDHALGAMFAGASAETAVRAAILHDKSSGGAVTVIRAGTPTD